MEISVNIPSGHLFKVGVPKILESNLDWRSETMLTRREFVGALSATCALAKMEGHALDMAQAAKPW